MNKNIIIKSKSSNVYWNGKFKTKDKVKMPLWTNEAIRAKMYTSEKVAQKSCDKLNKMINNFNGTVDKEFLVIEEVKVKITCEN